MDTHKCYVCNQPAKLLCTCCHRAWYCSASCQQMDWPAHKQETLSATKNVESVAFPAFGQTVTMSIPREGTWPSVIIDMSPAIRLPNPWVSEPDRPPNTREKR